MPGARTAGDQGAFAVEAMKTARESGSVARAALASDSARIGATLANAFHDDPLICFLLDDAARRPAAMPKLFELLFRFALPSGACDVTTGFEAAAIWLPPGAWHIPIWRYLTSAGAFLSIFGVTGCLRALKTMDYIESRHPKEPHVYLQVIGTDPAFQGKGYGGVVMRRRLAEIDARRLPAYLESSKASNIPIYQSFGFEVTGEITVPGGPVIYPMWRPAR